MGAQNSAEGMVYLPSWSFCTQQGPGMLLNNVSYLNLNQKQGSAFVKTLNQIFLKKQIDKNSSSVQAPKPLADFTRTSSKDLSYESQPIILRCTGEKEGAVPLLLAKRNLFLLCSVFLSLLSLLFRCSGWKGVQIFILLQAFK